MSFTNNARSSSAITSFHLGSVLACKYDDRAMTMGCLGATTYDGLNLVRWWLEDAKEVDMDGGMGGGLEDGGTTGKLVNRDLPHLVGVALEWVVNDGTLTFMEVDNGIFKEDDD
ncbi:unnamed protein product [Dovyalis caffra]|uniref:Uncharacterized protein n=1 Tax=Dovyalis caffra TaxID=77055 RepID=A0AAV1RQ98_9ROSI|nr:unnamed protein product [Dovyalis caffra]